MGIQDTIAAIATPSGVGGIGIVRVSGPKAGEIGRLLFRPAKDPCPFATHHLYHGDLVSPETVSLLDEVLITLMRGPHSFTGEDVLEIHCHGGPVILRTVLEAVLRAGARPADPGEFTRRAFLNNRLDLSQAEAVADLIMAKTLRGLDASLAQLKGRLSEKIHFLRESLLEILVLLEADVDFPDEDLDVQPVSRIAGMMEFPAAEIKAILETYDEGRVYREGLKTVIAGRPNVGKSSLLNRLLGEERAIVTPIPGTTRDFIEEAIHIEGLPVRLTDTAGIRDAENMIEQKGVERVWEKLSGADAVIFLLDGSEELSGEDRDLLESVEKKKCIVAINKSDLPQRLTEADVAKTMPGVSPIRISAKYGDGLSLLKEKILALAMRERSDSGNDIVIGSLRHKAALEKAAELVLKARESLLSGLSPEFAAMDIKEALRHLDEIVGETTSEEILDRIFSAFCIGK
jgi:tRNA modification GTPase